MKIKTERLRLRPIKKEDATAVFGYRSDAITNKYQGSIPKTIEGTYDFIENTSPKIDIVDTWFQLVILENESQAIIGDIGIHFLDEAKKQVEIGCTLAKEYHGKGFATEALKGTINYLFNTLNKHRIIGSIDPQNIQSIGLLKRIGFRKEAHFKESLWVNGEWVDDIIYALLKSEWDSN